MRKLSLIATTLFAFLAFATPALAGPWSVSARIKPAHSHATHTRPFGAHPTYPYRSGIELLPRLGT